MVLDEIDAGFSLWDRFKKHRADKGSKETVVSRFVMLFEAHGVHRNQIPRFFDHNLSLENVATDKSLLPTLTPDVLQAAAELFAVRLEWLECADDQVYKMHHFYKDPISYASFLEELINNTDKHRIYALLAISLDSAWEEDAVLILEEEIGELGEEVITKYHLCAGWVHKYWKCRAELAACVALTLKHPIYLKSYRTIANLSDLCKGNEFVYQLYQKPAFVEKDEVLNQWHPDHWLFNPGAFMEGVSEGEFGKKNALAMWLDYDKKGLMEAGYACGSAREKFRVAFEELA
ncbi:MAG: hypothetical protein COB22_01330 [Cycloclasticus sp.]|nr:MAG: hypothetical protein COB22_01330 [Cycloclasticus sp.]